jgi:hypothetical protein
MPAGLGAAGAALWKRLTAPVDGDELEFSVAELVTLELACRQAEDIAGLEKVLANDGPTVLGSRGQVRLSPIPAELRLQRAALARLVALLAIPDGDEDVGLAPTAFRAQRAADARWRRQAAVREARRGTTTA